MNSWPRGIPTVIVLIVAGILCLTKCSVLHRTANDFDSLIETNNLVLMNFHEPWCEHCAAFDPMYEKLASALEEDYPEIKVVKMDTTGELELLDMLRIKSYPQMVLFVNGLPVPFKESLDADRLRKWVTSVLHKRPVQISTSEQLNSLYHPVYYIFTADESSSRFVLIDNLAKKAEQDLILFTTSSSVMQSLDIRDNNTLYVVRQGKQRAASPFMADYTVTAAFAFLETSKHDLMKPFDVSEFKLMLARGIPVLIVYGDSHSTAEVTTDLDVS